MSNKFTVLGDGTQAKKHISAIENIQGKLVGIYDPVKYNHSQDDFTKMVKESNWIVICSPSVLHRTQIKDILDTTDANIICEKPVSMPWEPLIDDNRVNVVLQYRYLDIVPECADTVSVTMARNKEYFESWKGSIKDTGGMFFHLFIHYIDLAINLNATFEGAIIPSGGQSRHIDAIDILNIDMIDLYSKMYEEIIFKDNGVKPDSIRYLLWVMKKLDILYTFTSPYKKVTMNEWVINK